jgi:uncharacterized protein
MRLLIIPISLLIACPVSAASFDCGKASTTVEKLICGNAKLSSLDSTMASTYKNLINHSGKADEIKAEQRQWLTERNACTDNACLQTKYEQRLIQLAEIPVEQSAKTPKNFPKKVGECVDSLIEDKTTRFEGAIAGEAGGEVSISFQNGIILYITKVDALPSENADKYMYSTKDFAKGDRVKLCLTELPKDCPPGDDRGKIYSVQNYKNKKTFSGVDAWHMCGGA